MKSLCFLFALCGLAVAQKSIVRLDPKVDALIPPGAVVETLCTGFTWAEGPVWDAKEKRLLFTDVPNNTIFQWKEGDKEATVFLKPSGFTGPDARGLREPGANGLAFDAKGQLLCCEHGDRRISCLTANGGKRTLTDNFQGKRFNSPNDLTVAPNGDVYFTDPPYGMPSRNEKDGELGFCGVFRVTPAGETTLVTREFARPNGVAISPDGKWLFVAQSDESAPTITRFPVSPDGAVGKGSLFFDAKSLDGKGAPDGLKVDAHGNVFSSGRDGVMVINPAGKLIGRILCGRPTANVALGQGWLYITSKDRVHRVKLAH